MSFRMHQHQRSLAPIMNDFGWFWRRNDIFGKTWGPKASWHLFYRQRKTPKNLVPTGDRTPALCVTGAHTTACSTAVDIFARDEFEMIRLELIQRASELYWQTFSCVGWVFWYNECCPVDYFLWCIIIIIIIIYDSTTQVVSRSSSSSAGLLCLWRTSTN